MSVMSVAVILVPALFQGLVLVCVFVFDFGIFGVSAILKRESFELAWFVLGLVWREVWQGGKGGRFVRCV